MAFGGTTFHSERSRQDLNLDFDNAGWIPLFENDAISYPPVYSAVIVKSRAKGEYTLHLVQPTLLDLARVEPGVCFCCCFFVVKKDGGF